MSVVVFNPTNYKLRYPEFADVDSDLLSLYFNEAQIYVDNTENSVILDTNIRGMILNMVVSHIAALQEAPLVGRVSSAGEGSVNVSTSYAVSTGSRAWWDQTRYGASAWQALAPYRCAIYIPAPSSPMTLVSEG